MYKIKIRDRLLLLGTVILAAYQIITGFDDLTPLSIWIFTIGFGILLVACLLLIILGFEGLESQAVVITSTAIPLSISLGLVSIHLPVFLTPYLIFCLVGFSVIGATRFVLTGKASTLVLALVHGIAGLIITLLPLILSIQGQVPAGYVLVSLGGGLMGLGGLLLAFLKAGRPILSQEIIYHLLPVILFLMSLSFWGGFSFLQGP
jgi:hypothetical protein